MSIFYISVPTRDYEALLRQKELDLVNLHVEVESDHHHSDVPDTHHIDTDTVVDLTTSPQVRFGGSIHGPPTAGPRPSGPPEVFQPGKPGEIILHNDAMNLHRVSLGGRVHRLKSYERDEQIEREIGKFFLEKHLEDTLAKYDLNEAASWSQSFSGKMTLVSFTVPSNLTDSIIQRLQSVGIGTKYGSTLTVSSGDVYYGPKKNLDETEKVEGGEAEEETKKKGTAWSDFVQSIKSRLTVAQVVSQVQANAVITFDFLMLVCVAGTIACLGLLEDNSVILVASMLISPLMGPIMALTFGAMIRDTELLKIGIRSELVGLGICLVVGFISGTLISIPHKFEGPWGWGRVKQWPTGEMVGRGQLWALCVGFLMAVPSGMGVALSILAGNAGSLVGVAIAASLLPPAVNCGLFWGISLVAWMRKVVKTEVWYHGCDEPTHNKTMINDTERYHTDNYEYKYCKNDVTEFLLLGTVSFGLTLVNIVVIFAVAVLILKIKEVAPYTTRQSLRRFWKEDLAATRKYNESHEDHDIAGIMDDINGAENSAEIKYKLDQDQVLQQVNRRMGVGPSILNDAEYKHKKKKEAELKKKKSSKSVKSQGAAAAGVAAGGGGWFSWFNHISDKDKHHLASEEKINKVT